MEVSVIDHLAAKSNRVGIRGGEERCPFNFLHPPPLVISAQGARRGIGNLEERKSLGFFLDI